MQNANGLTTRGFRAYTTAELPKELHEILSWYEAKLHMVPNLVRVMAGAPALLRSYWQTQLNLQQFGTLSPSENNVVQMTIARENACRYCLAGHQLAGRLVFNTPDDVMNDIRDNAVLSDAKLAALHAFTLCVYATRGRVSDADIAAFLDAGYTRSQALDVVVNVAVKVMSNFTNHMAGTELDEALKPFAQSLPF